MKIGILLLDIIFVFMATFIYCSFKISSKEAREEYEKEYN